MKKNVNVFKTIIMNGIIISVILFYSCATIGPDDIKFIPEYRLQSVGIVLQDENVGRFSYEDRLNWRFELESGEGDTDNNLFEIVGDNQLIAKKILESRKYSIRVKMMGMTQTSGGIPRIFTFSISGEPPKFSLDYQGSWLCERASLGWGFGSTRITIRENTIYVDSGPFSQDNYKLIAKSSDSYTLKNEAIAMDHDIIILNIQFVNDNLVISNSTVQSDRWKGTYKK
jgi:hypothetical protein